MKVSKLCVIFGEINGTGGRGTRRGPPFAESAFPVYRSRGPRRGRRARAARNRRSNGDRVRVGFKISKITNTRFKRDSAVDSAPGGLIACRAPTAERPRAAVTRGAVPRRGPLPRVRPPARAIYQTSEFGYVGPCRALLAHGRYPFANFPYRRFDAPRFHPRAEGTTTRVPSFFLVINPDSRFYIYRECIDRYSTI